MAIYIQLLKKEEDASGAVYDFGPADGMIGSVFVARGTRDVSLLHIEHPAKASFYLPRVMRALEKVKDKFPETAVYAA